MEVAVIGVSHKQAPVEMRSKVVFTDSKKIEAMNILLDQDIEEVVILSTCNRSEIYIISSNIDRNIQIVETFYVDYFCVPEIKPYLFVKKNEEAISHLYHVACGLDSIVLGEDQILGQVKDASIMSMEMGASKKFLNKLFRETVTFAKRIKTEYKISENPLSISSIGIHFLKELYTTELKEKNILIIGTGEMGILAMRYLVEENCTHIYIANRTSCKAEELKDRFPMVQTVDYRKRYDVLPDMDIVICSTSSPHLILQKSHIPKLQKELTIMDLAVPRDVEASIEKIEGVQLFTVDALKEIAQKNMHHRNQIAQTIRERIRREVDELSQWIFQSRVDPIIQSFHELCDEVAHNTFELMDKKMSLNHREKLFVKKVLQSSLKRIVRTPINQLKQLKEEEQIREYQDMINHLFHF